MVCGLFAFPVSADEPETTEPAEEAVIEAQEADPEEEIIIEEPEAAEEAAEEIADDTAEAATEAADDPAEDIPVFAEADLMNDPAAADELGCDYATISARFLAACEAYDFETVTYSDGSSSSCIMVDVRGLGVTYDNWGEIISRFKCENTRYFYLDSFTGVPSGNDFKKLGITIKEGLNAAQLPACIAQLDQAADDLVSGIDPMWSDAEKLLYLHDSIVTNNDYDLGTYTGSNNSVYAYDAYGCLVLHNCVCEGYARAFDLLCKKIGIECQVVTSSQNNHAWNVVKLGSYYYYIDCTADDPVLSSTLPGTQGNCGHTAFLNSYSACLNSSRNHKDSDRDWKADGWKACNDYPTATTYDSYFWNGNKKAFFEFAPNKWIGVEGRKFYVYDFTDLSKTQLVINGAFTSNGGYISPSDFSSFVTLARYGNDLIAAAGDDIYQIVFTDNLKHATATKIFTNPNPSSGDIYGINLNGNTLTYYINASETGSRITSGTVSLPAASSEAATVTSCSITLDGTIGINFLLTLPAQYLDADAPVVISGPSGEKAYALPRIQPNGNYKFTYTVDPSDIDEDVTVRVIGTDGSNYTLKSADNSICTDGFTYSVSRYITKASEYYSPNVLLVSLLGRLDSYCRHAKVFFGTDHGAGAVADPDLESVTAADFAGFAYACTGSNDVSYYGTSLTIGSDITIKHYLYMPAGADISNYDIRINGADINSLDNVSVKRVNSTMIAVTISGIDSSDIMQAYDISVKTSGGADALALNNYSMLSYMYKALTSNNVSGFGAAFINLVKSCGQYYSTAWEYNNQ